MFFFFCLTSLLNGLHHPSYHPLSHVHRTKGDTCCTTVGVALLTPLPQTAQHPIFLINIKIICRDCAIFQMSTCACARTHADRTCTCALSLSLSLSPSLCIYTMSIYSGNNLVESETKTQTQSSALFQVIANPRPSRTRRMRDQCMTVDYKV